MFSGAKECLKFVVNLSYAHLHNHIGMCSHIEYVLIECVLIECVFIECVRI
jgi:hypothetical protein